jgi:hypothetical protein
MSRGSRWRAVGWGAGLAGAGAAIAYPLAGGRWAAAGAVIGALTGAAAPLVHDAVREQGSRHEAWRGTLEQDRPRSWARLLDPQREIVGFAGRQDELTALVAWCEDDDGGRLRLVTGPGGVGKTRLAVEFTGRMRELGWKAERIAVGGEGEAIAALREVSGGRALLVADYAETRAGLGQLLRTLAGDQGGEVRVLLLARSAGDWWDQLGVGEPAVWDLVQAARLAELALPTVVDADLSDADVVATAVTAFARELGVAERTVEISGATGSGRSRVLDLHAAALVAILDGAAGETVRVDIGQVLDELLRHEQHFWYDTARACGLWDGQDGATLRVLRQVVAAGCLLGAASEEEACALSTRTPGMAPSAKIGGWLQSLYPPDPGTGEWIGSVQPDRLAELHTVRELAASPEFAEACLAGLNARQALRAVTLLARASADYPDAADLLSQVLPRVAGFLADLQAPSETLTAIVNAIPFPTVILAPAAAALVQRILRLLPPATAPAVRAYWLDSLGVRFSELGRPAQALPVTEEAVTLYGDLAAASPDRYRPDLANSLTNLSEQLAALGRKSDADAVRDEDDKLRQWT